MTSEPERPVRWVVDPEHPEGHAVPMTDEEVAQLAIDQGGPWVPSRDKRTLADLAFDQDGQDIVCVGCGLTRVLGDAFWRAYGGLTEEQARRAQLPADEDCYVCPTCEPWVLFGTRVAPPASSSN